jgi:hypothetical protein
MADHVQDETSIEAKEIRQLPSEADDDQVVTVGLLRQLLQDVLEPQFKESTTAKANIRTVPKSYANVAAAPPAVVTRPRRVTKASSTIFQERKEAAEFLRLHFNTPRANYKNLNSSKEVTQAIRGALKSAGIASKVPLFSKIGDSVIASIGLGIPQVELYGHGQKKPSLISSNQIHVLPVPERAVAQIRSGLCH